jgi:hypothetical protein
MNRLPGLAFQQLHGDEGAPELLVEVKVVDRDDVRMGEILGLARFALQTHEGVRVLSAIGIQELGRVTAELYGGPCMNLRSRD